MQPPLCRIAERHDSTFQPAQVSEYLRAVYAEVEDHADEFGRIEPKAVRTDTRLSTYARLVWELSEGVVCPSLVRLPLKQLKAVTMNAAEEVERLTVRVGKWETLFEGIQDILTKLSKSCVCSQFTQLAAIEALKSSFLCLALSALDRPFRVGRRHHPQQHQPFGSQAYHHLHLSGGTEKEHRDACRSVLSPVAVLTSPVPLWTGYRRACPARS